MRFRGLSILPHEVGDKIVILTLTVLTVLLILLHGAEKELSNKNKEKHYSSSRC